MKTAQRLILLLALPGLTGCVGYLPIPTMHEDHGRQVTRQMVAFIHPGSTTHTEVITRLGTNYVSLPQDRAIAYPWDTKGGDYPSDPLLTLAGFAGALIYANVDVPTEEAHLRYHAWALKFDDHQQLVAWKYFKTATAEDRIRTIQAWAAK